MTFLQLYGDELDRELGTEDRTQRFTTARRKAAINAAQLEFLRRTECVQRTATIPIVSGTAEYDLETAFTDFFLVAASGVSIRITEGASVRYLEGDDFTQTTISRLNADEPGWRSWTPGTPSYWYLQRQEGQRVLGFATTPSFATGTWEALVPYVLLPADMSDDTDEPFTYDGNPIRSLRPYHRALVYYAAFDLEKLRKDTNRMATFAQLFEGEVQKYRGEQEPKGARQVRLPKRWPRHAWRAMDPRV